MGCFNSKPDDDGQNVAKAASNPLVKGAAKGPYGATAGAGGNAGAGSHLAPDAVARNISTGGVTAVPGRVVWIGHSAGSDRRHVGYDMLYRVLSIYCGAGSGLVVGDVVSRWVLALLGCPLATCAMIRAGANGRDMRPPLACHLCVYPRCSVT